jgi:phosphomannomutase
MSTISKMFKAYDLRGTVPELTKKVFYLAGKAIVQVLTSENLPTEINLVHDTRTSSPEFYQALYYGIKDGGGTPVALGIGSTDFMYSAALHTSNPGIIVTASHNPKNYNGMKILKKVPEMMGLSSGLDNVRDYVLENIDGFSVDENNWEPVSIDEEARVREINCFKAKIKDIANVDQVNQLLRSRGEKLKIAVDAGNGMGGWIMSEIEDLYPEVEFVKLYWELDGNFPNHPANPQEFETLVELQDTVRSDKSIAMGLAFDGDGDRLGVVDDKAEIVQGDFLVSYFAKTLLSNYYRNPNPDFDPAVVYITPGSRCVPETITQTPGIAIPSKQGHTHIKAQMSKYRAIYGGEFSGHHYFGEFGFMDSGVLTAALLIQIVVESEAKLSEVFKTLNQSYFISDLMNPRLPEGETFDNVKAKLYHAFPDAEVNELDGISVNFPDWRFSMRPSNTEPVVRFILETRDNTTDEKVELVKKVTGLS